MVNKLYHKIKKFENDVDSIYMYDVLYIMMVKLLNQWSRIASSDMKAIIALFYKDVFLQLRKSTVTE